MPEHFANYIRIGRYKCFENFSVDGLKRVNLISGKNNVGKTALMEAMYVTSLAKDVPHLFASFWLLHQNRNRAESVEQALTDDDLVAHIKQHSELINCKTNLNDVSFEYQKPKLEKLYICRINDRETVFTEGEVNIASIIKSMKAIDDASFIPNVRDSQADIIFAYARVQEKDRESDVNAFVTRFDDSIENVKVIGDAVQCKVPSRDGGFEYRSLNEFGDGLRHYLSVITELFAAENTYIFIDELDNGIHYTLLDQLWEIILTLSKELNVQVFATTHSKECIESYCRVAKKLDEREVSLITLVKNKSQQIKAIVRDFDMLTDSIDDNREVRGW
ncbi:AAA family ATPase [Leucothrix mucor]|uniref:AAA family ATPase n=1 Tax=Leucothrix mucor TaxID=45248 RepID=UPI0003B5CD59|nr:AAA family ATPase [Leucothrix mucor]